MRGGLGEVSTNSPESSRIPGTAASGCAGASPGSARPVGTFAPSRRAAPHGSSTGSGSRRPPALHPPRGTALPPASHSPLPPPPLRPAHPAARPPAVASRRRQREPPPARQPAPPRAGARPPAPPPPAGGMVRSPEAGVAGAGRPKGRRNGGGRWTGGRGRGAPAQGKGELGRRGGGVSPVPPRRTGRRGRFVNHKYESPGNFLPAGLVEQRGRLWEGAGPVFLAWSWGCVYLRTAAASAAASSSSSPAERRWRGGGEPGRAPLVGRTNQSKARTAARQSPRGPAAHLARPAPGRRAAGAARPALSRGPLSGGCCFTSAARRPTDGLQLLQRKTKKAREPLGRCRPTPGIVVLGAHGVEQTFAFPSARLVSAW